MDVFVEIPVDTIDKFLQSHDHSLDSGLISSVMILNACQDVRQAPIYIGFDLNIFIFILKNENINKFLIVNTCETYKTEVQK